MEQIPYVAFESAQIRLERTNRRLFIKNIVYKHETILLKELKRHA